MKWEDDKGDDVSAHSQDSSDDDDDETNQKHQAQSFVVYSSLASLLQDFVTGKPISSIVVGSKVYGCYRRGIPPVSCNSNLCLAQELPCTMVFTTTQWKVKRWMGCCSGSLLARHVVCFCPWNWTSAGGTNNFAWSCRTGGH